MPAEYRDVLPDAMASYITADLRELTTPPVSDESWAPEDCTLPTAERLLRAAEFGELFGGEPIPDERLEADPAAELTVAEAQTRS